MARFATCRNGHDGPRNKYGGCYECKRLSNAGDLRLPGDAKWTAVPDPPEDRQQAWNAYCARLDAAIARTRRQEGFDGTRWEWWTLGSPDTYVPVTDAKLRRAS